MIRELRAEGRALGHLLARPAVWLLLGLALLGATAAYQVRHPVVVDVGGADDAPYLQNFNARSEDPATGRTFRVSDAYSYVSLPGLGGGAPYSVTVTLNPGRPALPVTIILNGETFLDQPLPDRWQTFTFAVDAGHPRALASRDLVVELRVPPSRGLLLDQVAVSAAGPGFVAPALSQLAGLAALLLLTYLFLGRLPGAARGRFPGRPPAPGGRGPPAERAALAGTALVALGLVGLLAGGRLPLTIAMPYLVLGALAAHLVRLAARPLAGVVGPEAAILRRLLGRPVLWAVLGLTGLGTIAAFQVRHTYDVDVGAPADQAYVQNLHDRAADAPTGRTFRPGGTYSYITLPGIGGGVPYSVTITLQPVDARIPITVILNGETFRQGPAGAGWQVLTFSVDATHPRALASRDLVIELRTPASSDLLLDRVTVSAPGAGFITPAWSQVAYLPAIVLLVYLLLGRALAGRPGGRRVPAGGAILAAGVLVAGLALVHLPLTVATAHLVTAGLLTYGLLVLVEPLARRITPQTPQGARAAAALVAGAFLVRYGLMALPESVIIDLPYHMKWMRELLAGNVAALLDPHGGLNQPPREWQLAVIIPKSPLFYFVAAPLALLPGPLESALAGFVCLLEASTVLFCYGILARFAPRLGGWRAGLWAGFVYAATPLSFRALAYGILPTILAQWLALACFTLLLAWAGAAAGFESTAPQAIPDRRPARHHAKFIVPLLVLLPAALVAFPTIAVFTTLVTGGLVLAWLGRRYRRLGWAVGGVLGAAWVVAIATYYGVYIADLLTQTLPQLLAPAAGGRGTTAAPPAPSTVHWTGVPDLLGWTLGYLVSPLPLLLGLAGLSVLWLGAWRRRRGAPGGRPEALLAALTGCWIAILPIFVLVNYRFDMIGKHLYYTMVPLALGSGITLALLARRGGRARQGAILLAGVLAWTALAFWIGRLVQAST